MWNPKTYCISFAMNERLLLLIMAVMTVSLQSIAQPYGDPKFKQKFNEADGLAFDGVYTDAIVLYKDLYAHDSTNANVNHGIGLCELGLGNYQKAINYLETATRNVALDYQEANWKEKRAPGKTYYYLASAYHKLGDFDKAVSNYFNYRSFIDMDDYEVYNDVKRQIEYAETAKELLEHPVNVKIVKMSAGINSRYEDFCPVISADQKTLIFTSRRETGTGQEMTETGEYFDDIFVCKKVGDNWSKPASIGPNINTEDHEAAIGLSPDGQTLYIYKDMDIYSSVLQDNEWSKPEKVGSDINTGSWETHATVSADGNLLIFTSDRPGGKGGRDLYFSKRLPNGEWGLAQNMGDSLNTPYAEESPFIAVDGNSLIFSSEGHRSMGGFDLFRSELIDGVWGSPKNVGYPINSPLNDMFFVTTPDGRNAYYSSVRSIGKGRQDIYLLKLEDTKASSITVLAGTMTVPVMEYSELGAKISVKNADGNGLVSEYRPNRSTGRYILILDPGEDYNVTYHADGYAPKEVLVDVPDNSTYYEINKTIELEEVVFGGDLLALQEIKRQEELARLAALDKKAMEDSLAQTAVANSAIQSELLAQQEADALERQRVEDQLALEAKTSSEDRLAAEASAAEAERKRKNQELEGQLAADAQKAKIAEERKAEMTNAAELARKAEEQRISQEQLTAQVSPKEANEQIDDPVAKKRAELLARIEKLKAAKKGVGYDKPVEPVIQAIKPTAEPVVKKEAVKIPPKQEVAEKTNPVIKNNPSNSIQAESLTSSEVENKKAMALARIAHLKEEKKSIDKSTSEKIQAVATAESDIRKADEELAELDLRRRKIVERKDNAEKLLSESQQAKKNLFAQATSNEQEQEQLLGQITQLESQDRRLEDERAREERTARLEADRLEELSRQEESARQAGIMAQAERKKQEALDEAERKTQEEKSKNSSANSLEDLRRMNEVVINENKGLRDQFAEVNRKLDIIMNNMGLEGKKAAHPTKPEPREAVFSTEELKSGKNFVLKNIFFDYNQASLKATSKKELNKLYYFLKDNSGVSIVVEGHTDSKGDDAYNMRLSQTRAESVVRYLTNMGISNSKLRAIGYGEKRPIAINQNVDGSDNPSGRALNRRIEIGVPQGNADQMEVEKISIPSKLQIGS
ncbi:MAG: outer membrane protein OmpA-like peptidoglycan-associated protein [Granulosicoccus sp.]